MRKHKRTPNTTQVDIYSAVTSKKKRQTVNIALRSLKRCISLQRTQHLPPPHPHPLWLLGIKYKDNQGFRGSDKSPPWEEARVGVGTMQQQPGKIRWAATCHRHCPLQNCQLTRLKKAVPDQAPSDGLQGGVEATSVCICGVVSRSDISVANYYL